MPPEQQIPRLDPANRMGIDFHAVRTLESRFGKTGDPEERRAAIESASFRNTGAHEGEEEKMRGRLLALLDRLEGKLTPEQLRLKALVEGQYDGEFDVFKRFEIYNREDPEEKDVAPPDLETVLQLFFERLTPQQLFAIFELMKEPHLELEPLVPFQRCLNALASHVGVNIRLDANLAARLIQQESAAGITYESIVGWNVGIVDVAKLSRLQGDPSVNLSQQFLRARDGLQRAGLRLIHPRRYALAQMREHAQEREGLDLVVKDDPDSTRNVLDDDTCDIALGLPVGYVKARSEGANGDRQKERVCFDVHPLADSMVPKFAHEMVPARNEGHIFRPEVVINVPRKAA